MNGPTSFGGRALAPTYGRDETSVQWCGCAVNINLVTFWTFVGDIVGQVFALLMLRVAAAEASIWLAVLVVYFRNRGSIAVEGLNLMKG